MLRLRFAATSVALAMCVASFGLMAQKSENLTLLVGKSIVLDYPEDVRQISTSNPEVVDASPATSREILLHGKANGTATIVIWSKSGQRTIYNISVEHNLEPLRKLLQETFPGQDIRVQATRDSLSLTGKVSTKEIADRAAVLAATLVKTAVNNIQVVPLLAEKQILLRVKFAELNRNRRQEFGVNILSTGALNTIGAVSTGQFSPPSTSDISGGIPGRLQGATADFTVTDALNVFAFRTDLNLAALVRALQTEGILQIMAEPNLVTTSGKEASFLVGGEFPIPVLQGGGNAGAVTIQFREFGIRLTFNPTVTENKTIKMYVKPEVSTIDIANGVSFSGFVIPALSSRRMETNIELAEGQSFVIGGLVDDRVQETMNKIPGLSSIPILGQLFKSRAEQKSKNELIVMVTPEVVQPLNPGDLKPLPVMPREFMGPVEMKQQIDPAKGTRGSNKNQKETRSVTAKNSKPAAASKESSPEANKESR